MSNRTVKDALNTIADIMEQGGGTNKEIFTYRKNHDIPVPENVEEKVCELILNDVVEGHYEVKMTAGWSVDEDNRTVGLRFETTIPDIRKEIMTRVTGVANEVDEFHNSTCFYFDGNGPLSIGLTLNHSGTASKTLTCLIAEMSLEKKNGYIAQK